MKKCPACAEEIQDEAIKCRYCGTDITRAESPGQHLQAALYQNPKTLGLAASLALFVGVFLPIIRMPVVGSLNYFSTGRGDGTLLLVAAAISVALVLHGRYQWLLATGLPAITMLLVVFVQLRLRISEMNASIETDLKDNMFAGLAQAFLGGVQLEYGWAVLFLGALLMTVAAVVGRGVSPATPASSQEGWYGFKPVVALVAGGGALAVGLLAFLSSSHLFRKF